VLIKEPGQKSVKYRTIRVREEVAQQLDEWRDLFEDGSMSEALWRIFSLAKRELKRVRDKKKKAREKFVNSRKTQDALVDLATPDVIESEKS
jgi:hypothetical protein